MKKETIFKTAEGEELHLSLSIRDMAAIEKDLDCSLYGLMFEFLRGGTLRYVTLDFINSVFRHAMPRKALKDGVTTRLTTEDEVDDIIDEHCAAGGTLDDVAHAALDTVLATGFFTPGVPKEGKTAEVEAEKKEPPSTQSLNG